MTSNSAANAILNLDFATSSKVVARMYSAAVGSTFVGGRKHVEGAENEALTLTGSALGNAKLQYVSVQYVIEPV